ncbi:MAG: cytochrome c oxidase subunit 4 [Thermogemmatispora sp.]|uniref:cytochrome c oxidase subunit 4 n=1 Tax=Thermogemmatispora sp. TaxID=1968838 RepID=UPI0026212199|nr:cytochrome c oxidase subunit 4 [Thermogemmatispora sp.]MBX5455613.1 cytochrome c oxidase subunit 4 [Thermogemmatispora sp.]
MINEEEQKDRPPAEGGGLQGQEEEKREAGNPGSAGVQQQLQGESGETMQVGEEKPQLETAEKTGDQSQGRPSRARVPRSPHPSLWPFVLALAIALVCLGVVTHPAVLVIGALLIVVAAVGWGLERY